MILVWRRGVRGVRELYEACGRLLVIAAVVLLAALIVSLLLRHWPFVTVVVAMLVILCGLAYVDAGPEPDLEYEAKLASAHAEVDRQLALADENTEQIRQLNARAMLARAAFGPTHDGREL